MTAPSPAPGAVAPCRSGRPPARVFGELLAAAALERERVRDPDALAAERSTPEPAERIAGVYVPITTKRAADNLRRLAATLRDADVRRRWSGRPIPTQDASLQSARPGRSGLTSTT